MQKFENLYIIGTSHISKQSINEIRREFTKVKPEFVAIELDSQRIQALLSEKQGVSFYSIKHIGIKGYIFALLGAWVSKKLGKIVGVKPGSEMKEAIMLAKKHKVKIALIDQPIQITLKRFSKTLTWKEKWNFVVDIFNGLILRKKDPLLNFDLRKVPAKTLIKKMLLRVKERYPNIHKTLIEERNYYMARKLKNLMQTNQKILAVVGAGHEDDIIKILRDNQGITYSYTINKL